MNAFFYALLGWLPAPLDVICCAVVFLFFLIVFLRLVCFILDLIPFL